ncbi:TPA: hypothetical protein DEO28_00825 [Candidatus Dependentiae bacterium]|nr:MAG: Inositol-1-monophosphatase [candidate division TM6 bacterium GW2011_GWE2_31_21]KKP54137.1 MAG: Inositol-1-monophosphatase [candidate division TM6 bacterium GW2011_GWF2_33_332]HBS47858.1 hypothetical protein [Candidatus Dependentiae bacterium]HBZ73043.1 hypothetical protein [Candidatus Dependentiae bacterium]
MNDIFLKKEFVEALKQIVREAGDILLTFINKKHVYTYKKDGSFATEVDLACETFLIEKLSNLLPQASFVAEETSNSYRSGEIDWVWVIDPIDGTTNFAYGFPHFAVNVALTYKMEPVLGITYNPCTNEMFFASLGQGAFLNDEKIMVKNRTEIEKSLVSMAVPCEQRNCLAFQDIVKTLQTKICSSIRKFGSASLDLAYVAAGRLDAAVIKYVYWWDIAAGIILIREAGGVISEFDKDTIDINFVSCLASNKTLAPKFKELLKN